MSLRRGLPLRRRPLNRARWTWPFGLESRAVTKHSRVGGRGRREGDPAFYSAIGEPIQQSAKVSAVWIKLTGERAPRRTLGAAHLEVFQHLLRDGGQVAHPVRHDLAQRTAVAVEGTGIKGGLASYGRAGMAAPRDGLQCFAE